MFKMHCSFQKNHIITKQGLAILMSPSLEIMKKWITNENFEIPVMWKQKVITVNFV